VRTYVTLDGLRGVAALSIVVLHCNRYFGDIGKPSAALAVDLFFVLSGFVLAYAYESKLPTAASAFLKARLIRLYPLYLLGTALGVVEALAILHTGLGSVDWTWQRFWVSLPFAIAMLPAPDQIMFPFDGVMWSIFFELLINVVWAIFWKPLQSTRILIVTIMGCGAGLAVSCLYWNTITGLGLSWPTIVGGTFRVGYSFFLGVLFFRFHHRWNVPKLPPLLLLVCLPVVLFAEMPVLMQLSAALFILPWFVLLGSQVEPRGLLNLISRSLGLASYGVYAIHKRLYLLTYGFVLSLGLDLSRFAPWIGIAFAAALVVGCLILNRIYDRPARALLAAKFGTSRMNILSGATQAP
jgi:peptidoglycan/LPS O-acetylase OafA/YrhL